MESRGHLGIYLRKDKSTVVCLAPGAKGNNIKVQGYFDIKINEPENINFQILARQIADGCEKRKFKFTEAAVALDCAYFMQHSVHSEFTDTKKITTTIRFDAEEALATDISDVALAFKIDTIGEHGSDLTVFTAKKELLSDIILALQSHAIDPIAIEPDVICLGRYIKQSISSRPGNNSNIYGILSNDRGYLLSSDSGSCKSVMRTFLLGSSQDRTEVLAREAYVTTALAGQENPVNTIKVFDTKDMVNTQALSERMSLQSSRFDLKTDIEQKIGAQTNDSVLATIAHGSALACHNGAQLIDFRKDFMPFQGKLIKLNRAFLFLGISLFLLAVAAGIFMQTKLYLVNHNRIELSKKFEPDYLTVMPNAGDLPSFSQVNKKLSSLLMRIENERRGIITNKDAISAKLTIMLKAFNSCAKETDLNVEELTISPTNIFIIGDTSSRINSNKLKQKIIDEGFNVVARLTTDADRDKFTFTVTTAD